MKRMPECERGDADQQEHGRKDEAEIAIGRALDGRVPRQVLMHRGCSMAFGLVLRHSGGVE
jgi:hypothetical protein